MEFLGNPASFLAAILALPVLWFAKRSLADENDRGGVLAVAAAIASGRADCGMGIPAAAAAVGLDFVPLFNERYDLVVPEAHYNSDLLRPLFAVLDDPHFRAEVDRG